MDFKLTEKQEALRKSIRDFAEAELKPIAFQLDERSMFPEEIVKKIGENKWMGLPYSEEYGGTAQGMLSYAIAVEELSRVDGGTGVTLSAHTSLGAWPIDAFGTPEQKKKYLVPLAKGEKIGAYGLTEENAGSDAGGTETTAVKDGDYYILNGKKIFITNAPYADIYVVFAVTTPGIGTHGISAFIVEKGMEGFTFGTHYNKMGIRSSATAELIFNNVRVPAENLLGKEGEGFKIAMKTLDGGRIGIASQALGIAQGAYEEALQYSKDRIQFGKPIARLQVIAFKLADMATKIRAARLMVYSAAEKKDSGEPYGVEAAMAKLYASDVSKEVVDEAVQIFGGSGFIKGIPVERFYRDSKITMIYEGTNEIQRLVIAGSIIGRLDSDKKKTNTPSAKPAKRLPTTGDRKQIVIKDGTPEEKVAKLLEYIPAKDLKGVAGELLGSIKDAKSLVAFGLGLNKLEDVPMIEDLAKLMGAVMSCTRPISEERQWMDLTRYVGVSGQKYTGDIYLGIGVSGQIQHVLGIKSVKTIIAINNDEKAPIFENADYGIVGDLYEIVPALIKALS